MLVLKLAFNKQMSQIWIVSKWNANLTHFAVCAWDTTTTNLNDKHCTEHVGYVIYSVILGMGQKINQGVFELQTK